MSSRAIQPSCRTGGSITAAVVNGKVTANVIPRCGLLLAEMCPPCWLTIWYAIESPNPVPLLRVVCDYTGTTLTINRSIWRSVVNPPKTRASRASVPVIPRLAVLLEEYRRSIGNPQTGVIFHSGNGLPINLDAFTRKVIQPELEANRIPWFGWHAFRRGLASNLYAMGAQDILVQRVLRHAKAHVTRDCYIKVFDRTLIGAMERLQAQVEELVELERDSHQMEFPFVDGLDERIAVAESQVVEGAGFSELLGG